MKRVILYIAMSLDGYIADETGGVDWLTGDGSDPENPGSYPAFYAAVDTVIMGYATYRQVVEELSPDRWVYSGKTSYVLTHKKLPSTQEIIFTETDPAALIARLKAGEGGAVWICGGASLVQQLMEADCIDEYCLSVIPTIRGKGIPLFRQQDTEKQLRLVNTRQYNGIVDLVYTRR